MVKDFVSGIYNFQEREELTRSLLPLDSDPLHYKASGIVALHSKVLVMLIAEHIALAVVNPHSACECRVEQRTIVKLVLVAVRKHQRVSRPDQERRRRRRRLVGTEGSEGRGDMLRAHGDNTALGGGKRGRFLCSIVGGEAV